MVQQMAGFGFFIYYPNLVNTLRNEQEIQTQEC